MPRTEWRHVPLHPDFPQPTEKPVSYSFAAKGDSKSEAILDAEAKFDDMAKQQPVHQQDRDVFAANLRNVVNKLSDPEPGEVVSLSCNGSISVTNPTAGPSRVMGVSSGVSGYVSRVTA